MSYEALSYYKKRDRGLGLNAKDKAILASADPDFKDRKGKSLFYYVIPHQIKELTQMLIDLQPKVYDCAGTNLLIHAVKMQDWITIQYMIDKVDVNFVDSKGHDALLIALNSGHHYVVEFLMKNGAIITERHLMLSSPEMRFEHYIGRYFKDFGDTVIDGKSYLEYCVEKKSFHLPRGNVCTIGSNGKTLLDMIIATKTERYYTQLVKWGVSLDYIYEGRPFAEHIRGIKEFEELLTAHDSKTLLESVVGVSQKKKTSKL